MSLDEDTLQLTVTIANKGAKPVCVLKWETIFEDEWWFAPFDFYKNDEFTKPLLPVVLARLELPKRDDYVYLDIDGKKEVIRDLGSAFPLNSKSKIKYYVQLQMRPQDCYETTKKDECTIENRAPLNWEKSNMIKGEFIHEWEMEEYDSIMEIESVKNSDWLDSLERSSPLKPISEKRGDFTVINCKDDDIDTLNKAHQLAVKWFEAATMIMDEDKKKIYKKWFGTDDSHHDDVAVCFREFADQVKEHFIYFCLPSKMSQPEWAAHVDPSLHGKEQHFINLHEHFFRIKPLERTPTLVHEMTHDIRGTEDVIIPLDSVKYKGKEAYGKPKCRVLARHYPELAAINAENFAFYAEEAYMELSKAKKASKKTSKKDKSKMMKKPTGITKKKHVMKATRGKK